MEINIETSTTACWQNLVKEALSKTHYTLTEDLESYLIFLLIRFTRDSNFVSSTLALEYLESNNLTGAMQQEQLRDVGDKCLMFAGFYPEQAHRKLVSLDYFVNIGRGAYDQIADITAPTGNFKGLQQLFSELSVNFVNLLDTLHQVRALDKTNQWLLDEILQYEKKVLQCRDFVSIDNISKRGLH